MPNKYWRSENESERERKRDRKRENEKEKINVLIFSCTRVYKQSNEGNYLRSEYFIRTIVSRTFKVIFAVCCFMYVSFAQMYSIALGINREPENRLIRISKRLLPMFGMSNILCEILCRCFLILSRCPNAYKHHP